MAVGLSTANLANKWLDMLRGTAFTAPAGVHVQLHTADPGASGTTAVASVATRSQITWTAATGGVLTSSGTAPSWPNWAGTNGQVISHVSMWDASSSGNFLFSIQLTAPKTMGTGDTLNLTAGGTTVSLTPLAA